MTVGFIVPRDVAQCLRRYKSGGHRPPLQCGRACELILLSPKTRDFRGEVRSSVVTSSFGHPGSTSVWKFFRIVKGLSFREPVHQYEGFRGKRLRELSRRKVAAQRHR